MNLIRHPPVSIDGNELNPIRKCKWATYHGEKETGLIVDPRELFPVKQQYFHKAKLFQDWCFVTVDGGELPS